MQSDTDRTFRCPRGADADGVHAQDADDDFFVERIAEASWMFEPLIIESSDRVKSTCILK